MTLTNSGSTLEPGGFFGSKAKVIPLTCGDKRARLSEFSNVVAFIKPQNISPLGTAPQAWAT